MSTHAMLFKQNPEGTTTGTYLNFDGYPEGAGRRLRRHHNAEAQVDALLALGELRGLNDDGTVDAYHRDRGEDLIPADTYDSADEALRLCSGVEYVYLWTPEDGWRCIGKWGRREDVPIPE